MAQRTRYAVVGLGSRSAMYTSALLGGDYADRAELVGYCDVNQTRMDYWNARYADKLGARPVPTFKADRFDEMVKQQRPDCVIVTSIDCTHHEYITRAMRLGCDAITEKPMTIDAGRCRQILDTIRETGKRLTVTFNYRYAPRNSKVKELLASGIIGEVNSVHFEWLLDTRHGADYFRRWHREKQNSGGLMVHKATHHFDLVNWWLDSRPRTVFAQGGLVFYGRANAEARGEEHVYDRAHGSAAAANDPFALHLDRDEKLRALYLAAEHEDGYFRDRGVFSDGITIEDDVAVLVRYRSGATMSYHLTAYSPWEGFRVAFNGDRGRLEYEVEESSYVSGATTDTNSPELSAGAGAGAGAAASAPREHAVSEPTRIIVRPQWAKPYLATVPSGESGHGGGDKRLLADVFSDAPAPDPLGRRADHVAGAYSILTGIAANRSMETGLPVAVDTLVKR